MFWKIFKIAAIVIVLVLGWVALELVSDFNGILLPWHRGKAIETTLAMGGLAPLPDDAQRVKISTRGSMFSREFILTFQSTGDGLRSWIKASPRLAEARPEAGETSHTRHYEVRPGEEDSIGGTVDIDDTDSSVRIDMSWS